MARNPRFGRPGGGRRLTSLAAAVVIKGGGLIIIPTPTPTPTPTLTLSPTFPSIASNAAAGSLVANIANVPAGVIPSVTPNDGRLSIAGDSAAGWKVVRGGSAIAEGAINFLVAAPGATGASGVVTVAASGTGTPTPSATRVAATRGEVQSDILAGTRTASNNVQEIRLRMFAGAGGIAAGSARISVPNFQSENADVDGPAYIVAAHIEVGGVAYPATWGGAAKGAVPFSAAEYISDPITAHPAIPAGTECWILLYREFEVGVGKPLYTYLGATTPAITGEASQQGALGTAVSRVGTPGALAVAGGWTANTSNVLLPPVTVLGTPLDATKPTFVVLGASIEKRNNDVWGDGANGSGGYVRIGLNPASGTKYAFTMLAQAGESAALWVSRNSKRKSYLARASHALIGYGGNDFTTGRSANDTVGSIKVMSDELVAAGIPLSKQFLLYPVCKTDSTDSWATTSGQTVRTGFLTWRADVVAGVQALGLSILDTRTAFEEPGMPGIWKAGGTTDGTHPQPAIHDLAGALLQSIVPT